MWFQSNEIRNDTKYYNLVISLIEILYKNLKNKKDFYLKKIANEIEETIKKTEYLGIYEATRKLFFKVDPTEIDYVAIFCSFSFLGFKKESPLNEYFISNLKDIKEYDVLSNSPYAKEIENFNYDIIDEEFLQNFNRLVDYIIQEHPDEENIKKILKKLKEPDRNTKKTINIQDNTFISKDNSPIKSDNDPKNNKNQSDNSIIADIYKDKKPNNIQDNALVAFKDNAPIKNEIYSCSNKNKDNDSNNIETDSNINIIRDNEHIHFPFNSPTKDDSNSKINHYHNNGPKNSDADINPHFIQDTGKKKEDIDNNLKNIQVVEAVNNKDNYDSNLYNPQDNSQKKTDKVEVNNNYYNSPKNNNVNMISIKDEKYDKVNIMKEDDKEKLKAIQLNIQKKSDENNIENFQSKNSFKEEVYAGIIPYNNDSEVNDNITNNSTKKVLDKDDFQIENFKKENDTKKNAQLKNEKNSIINSTTINSNIEEDTSNNEKTEISSNKKIVSETDDDSYEKFIVKNKFQYEENIPLEKSIEIIPKRIYRVSGIIQAKSKIKQLMNEFCTISKYQKDLLGSYCAFQENYININSLKRIISKIQPPVIINVKRKFIDLITYWVIKKNAEKFNIDEEYIPKDNYLEQISKILKNKDQSDEIKKKIIFISNLKTKKTSSKSYPITIKDKTLESLLSYFKFYKSKCSNVIHIGKEGFNYYNLDTFTENGNVHTYKIFKKNENEKKGKQIKIQLSNESKSEKNSWIDMEFLLKFLFDSNFGYAVFKDKLNNVKKEKSANYDSPTNSNIQDSKKIMKILEKSTDLPEFELDDFEQDEQASIQNAMNDFNSQITSLKELIRSLDKKEKILSEYFKIKKEIDEKLFSLVEKECIIEDKYYIKLDQKVKGSSFLFYLQYKYMKIKILCILIEEVFKNYSNFLKKNKNNIEKMVIQIKKESDSLYKIISAENKIKSGKDIFLEWKKKEKYIYNYNFQELIELLKKNFENISSIKIDDDVINDMINSCWLVKNKLDDYVLD